MNIEIIEEAAQEVKKVEHHFSEREKEFIVQFAFKSGSMDLTKKLITEFSQADTEEALLEVMQKYASMTGDKTKWIDQVENLLVALEMYRIEEEKAIIRLAGILKCYGIEVNEEEIRGMELKELKSMVRKGTKEVR